MAEELQDELKDLSPKEQEKLRKLMEKDSKSYRSPTGPFKWLVSALGGGMVLFYFYTAGLAAVATQYHRGVYVFVTYVLVFLLYPAGKTRMRIPLSLVIGGIISSAVAALGFYETVDSFHAEITNGSTGLIGAILLGAVVIGTVFSYSLLLYSPIRSPQLPGRRRNPSRRHGQHRRHYPLSRSLPSGSWLVDDLYRYRHVSLRLSRTAFPGHHCPSRLWH
jgi:hypothetical protein